MRDTDKEYCRILYDILLKKGVKEIVLSPGSRNAPLLIGAACRPFKRHIITDERTAAFVALGISMTSSRPVALACTSGTALYNYAPAIAEAYYQHIPLIVISADRPLEWIDQDDSQTLIQPEALDKIVKGSFDIPVMRAVNDNERWYVNRIINEASNLALSGRRGPVHINIRFDNPLTNTIGYEDSNPRIIECIDELNLPPHIFKHLGEELRNKKILITAGYMQPDNQLNKVINELCKLPNVALMCETLSNLHLPGNPYSVDTSLSYIESNQSDIEKSLRPEVVISMGGALVSRKLKEFIRRNPPKEHWTLGDTLPAADCFMNLTKHIEISPSKFFKGILKYLKKGNAQLSDDACINYSQRWHDIRRKAAESHGRYLAQNNEWTELKAFEYILNHIPSSSNLFLANGTVVRYGQLFTDRIPHAIFGCRGVSGIDGTSATAVGCAMAYPGDTILITGDMAMAYDTGVLGLKDLPRNFKIILINNEGGGIFRFIPSTRHYADREELFCASPTLPTEKLADAYGWTYFKADSIESLEKKFGEFLDNDNNTILEIKADKEISADMLVGYMKRK